MPSLKISALPELTTAPISTDLLAIVDTSGTYITKKITVPNAIQGAVVKNAPITGATNTKIAYDAKGLVTSGTAATTADINDSTGRRYVTDANLVVIGNTTNTNSGDQTLPVKATAAELDTGTDDGKFATALGIKNAHNVPNVVPSTAGKVMTSDGTDWISSPAPVAVSVTTKGDLQTHNATVPDRLAVGLTNGQVLAVDSGETTGLKWITPPGSNSFVTNELVNETPNGVIVAFTVDNTPVSGSAEVFLNGQLQQVGGGNDYTITGSTITFNTAPLTGSVILVTYQMTVVTAGNADTVDSYHANTTPTASQIPVLDVNAKVPQDALYLQNSMSRQALINGNFDVWQRSTSTTPVNGAYSTADHYGDYFGVDGGTLPTLVESRQILSAEDIANAYYHWRLNTDGAGSSLGVNSFYITTQPVEHGTRFLAGLNKKVTLSFWARSSITGKKLGLELQQYYGSGGSPTATENIIGETFTLTSTWTKYTHTFTTNTLVGKTFGTANDDVLGVAFWFMWGSGLASRVGTTGAETFVGAGNIDMAQIQLCAGEVALPFEPKSYSQELTDCQRYCYSASIEVNYPFGEYGIAGSTTNAYPVIDLPVPMRKQPALENVTASDWRLSDALTTFDLTSISINNSSPTNASNSGCSWVQLDCGVASGLTQFRMYRLTADATATRQFTLQSEL